MSRPADKPLLLLVGVLSACTFLVGSALEMEALKLLTKGVLVITLGFWVWRSGADRFIALGLFFGAAGDIFLNIPGAFLPGMVAFALGHGLYVYAFWRWQPARTLTLIIPIVLYLAFALGLMLPGTGELSVPVTLYMGIIGAMIWRAAAVATLAHDRHDDWLVRWLPVTGALLFAFSDTLIGINKFVTPLSGVHYPIILAYWAGQFLIAASAIVRQRG